MVSADIEATYENVSATCPSCGQRNIFNRRSDLKDLEPIAHASVSCESCRAAFDIGGDMINPAHEMLLLECRPLFDGKQYMQTVLGVAQAYEVFFGHFAHVRLVYKPGARAPLEELNRLGEQLYEALKPLPFDPMRRVFLRLALEGDKVMSVEEASAWIQGIPGLRSVGHADMEAVPSERLRKLLLGVFGTTINVLRNRIVHKNAYRPTREETWAAYEDGYDLLFALTRELRVGASANEYINGWDDD